MAKIKGFKKLGLDLVKIQVIPNFFKGYIWSSPALWWNSAVYFAGDGNRQKKIAEGKVHEVKGFFTHSRFLAVTNIPETPVHTREKLKTLTAQQDLKIIFKSF